ncbi:SGNH/GDSL hydrolase family protein [Fundidesulfovibrio agrisoli]|uniref:SGNH/GDSL hydrolase family protein n=1 Tax=Fundidesulfovibrio agrisoli TaxID=2922717 RepID=UPI001FADF5FF|nr:SGNH/GDSL hydrolase family protein [Fundidesulfovibrio agrisoli]
MIPPGPIGRGKPVSGRSRDIPRGHGAAPKERAILILAIILLVLALHAVLLPGVRKRLPVSLEALAAGILVLDSLLLGFLLLELYFSHFYDQSDGFNLTRAGKKWFERHWQPINKLGYRDMEVTPPGPGQRVLVVLGDSFAAGHGVKQAGDRFSDVAARALGEAWRVYNVSKIGWDTPDEIKALEEFPVKPDVVVFSYYVNDIFAAARQVGYPANFAVNLPKGLTKTLLENSALADYLYWRMERWGGNLTGGGDTFWASLQGAYADPAVWGAHNAELTELARYCRENHIALVAVVFPMLQAPGQSAPITAKVAGALTEQGAAVLDLSPVFTGTPPSDLVVGSLDAHPNEATHKRVGEMIVPMVRELEKTELARKAVQ